MTNNKKNIHPIFNSILNRKDNEEKLKQRAKVIWLTGLSGSGKSTIAIGLESKLHKNGYFTKLLDGDNVRTGINNNLGFSEDDRTENIRRIAEISKLFTECGIITINSFVSPTSFIRDLAKDIIGKNDFIEVFVNVSIKEAEARDVKGLYKKARSGKIKNFTGIDSPFEEPKNPHIILNTDKQTVEESVNELYDLVIEQIKMS